MATLNVFGRQVSAQTLNELSTLSGGPLGLSPIGGGAAQTVSATPTAFSYVVGAPSGGSSLSGTGENLIYDANNRPIGGTITTLAESLTTQFTAGPLSTTSYELADISIDAATLLAGTFGTTAFADDVDVNISYDPFGPFTRSPSVETGDGRDDVNVNIDAFVPGEFAQGTIAISTGANGDTVRLTANVPAATTQLVSTGAGRDQIIIQADETSLPRIPLDQINTLPIQVISDFDPANDEILLQPFSATAGVGTEEWVWSLTDNNGQIELRAENILDNGATIPVGARILLQGVDANSVTITDNGVLRGVNSELPDIYVNPFVEVETNLVGNYDRLDTLGDTYTFSELGGIRNAALQEQLTVTGTGLQFAPGIKEPTPTPLDPPNPFEGGEFTAGTVTSLILTLFNSTVSGQILSTTTEMDASGISIPATLLNGPTSGLVDALNELLDGGGVDPEPDVQIGTDGDDALFGTTGDDVILGRAGNDAIDGGIGDDRLFGESGNDRIFAGAGDDALFGGGGADFLVGDAEGTSGVDGIFGGEGSDEAYGGFGADYIQGDGGNDTLHGETGADQILGGEGNDVVFGGSEDDVLFGENGEDVLFGQVGNDTISGGFGNDTIDGGDGVNIIFGEDGDDLIFAGEGAEGDFLSGGNGNDMINGGAGNDYVVAGAGADVVTTGVGADVVRLETGNGFIFWQDYEDGQDKIDAAFVAGGLGSVFIGATLDLTGTYISYADTQLILNNIDFNLINEDDFLNLEEVA